MTSSGEPTEALPPLLQDEKLDEKLAKKLDAITSANWQMLPLHVEFQGAHILSAE